jgi:hypothetical protein
MGRKCARGSGAQLIRMDARFQASKPMNHNDAHPLPCRETLTEAGPNEMSTSGSSQVVKSTGLADDFSPKS